MFEWDKEEKSTGSTVGTNAGSDAPLVIFSNKKKMLQLFNLPASIGKNGDMADVSFFHDSVSNLHCRVYCKNRQVSITDLGTPAGTFVNGKRLKADVPCVIDDGFKLMIGKVKFDISINYAEIARRERVAMIEAHKNAIPQPKTYTVTAREVSSFEYDESEVVHVACAFEPLKKKARYTQEVKMDDIHEAQAEQEPPIEPSAESTGGGDTLIPPMTPGPELVPENDDTADTVFSLTGIIEDTGAIEEILADHFPFNIGRKNSMNDYVISMEGVSRKHLCITQKDGIYYVTDLNSTNGVKVNGIRIPPDQEFRIQPGDAVTISGRTYTVGFTSRK